MTVKCKIFFLHCVDLLYLKLDDIMVRTDKCVTKIVIYQIYLHIKLFFNFVLFFRYLDLHENEFLAGNGWEILQVFVRGSSR